MPEFNDIVTKDIFPSPGLKDLPMQQPYSAPLPDYQTPKSPYDLDRFGGGSGSTSNPLGDFLNTFENTAPSLAQQARSTGFNAEEANLPRYTGSEDFHKLGLELDGSNEERYGLNQSWGDVLSNGFSGLTRLAANGFVDNWKGYGRMIDSLVTHDWSKLYGDPESMLDINKTFNDAMNENPIYATQEGQNTFWNRQTAGNFLQQSGFAVGAAVGMLSEQLVSKAIEAGLTATGVGAPVAGALEAASDVETAANVSKWAKLTGKAKDFFNAAENFKALKKLGDIWTDESVVKKFITTIGEKTPVVDIGFDIAKTFRAGKEAGIAGSELAWDIAKVGVGGVKRLMSESNFAFTEARMEAANTYSDLYSKLYNDYTTSTGKAPDELTIQNINKAAMTAADKNFNFNTAILALSNRIEFDNIFKNNKVVNNILKKYGLDEAVENRLKVVGQLPNGKTVPLYYETGMLGAAGVFGKVAADFGKAKAFQVVGGSLLKGLAHVELTEGIQELLQNMSQTYFQDYYAKAYKASFNPDYTPQGSLGKAIDSQLNMDGLKTFMSGALTGLMLHGPQHMVGVVLEKGNERITDLQKTSNMDEKAKAEYYKKKADAKTEAGKHYAEFNAFAKDPSALFNEAVKNLNFQKEGTTALDDAAKNNDKFTYENIRTAMLEKMIAASVRNNTHEALIDTLESYGKNMSKEEFEKAFVGADYTSENKKQAADYTQRVVDSIKFYNNTWNKLQDRYSNRFNPNRFKFGTKEFFNEALKKQALDNYIEMIASNEFKAKDTLDRMTSIFGKISSSKDLGASLANTFNVMGSDLNISKEMEVLNAEIRLANEQLKSEDLPKDQRGIIEKSLEIKKEQLQHLTDWKDTKGELLNEALIDKCFKAFKGYTESKNKESGKDITINQQNIEDHFLDFTDYIKLQDKNKRHVDAINMLVNPKNFTELHDRLYRAADDAYWKMLGEAGKEYAKKQMGDENISFIISMYDRHGVFEPNGTLIDVFDNIEDARKAKEKVDASLKNEAPTPENVDENTPRVTIKVKDKNGVESEIELIEGLRYITEADAIKRIGKDKKEYITYDQDIIKINKIDKEANTVTITVNDDPESVTYQLQEFADLAGKLDNFSNLTADEKIYYNNRNKLIRLKVSKTTGTLHKITGEYADRDYSNNSFTINARLDIKKEDGKWVLKLKYTNPVSGKETLVDFNMAYYKKYAVKDASGKAALDLNLLPTEAEAQEKARQERVAKNYSQQIQALQLLINEQDGKSALRQKRREEIDVEIKNLLQSIQDDETSFEIANEELAKKLDKRKRGVKESVESYEKIVKEYPERIKQAKETAAKLEQEKADIEKELEAFKAAKELYTQGLTELEENKEPFLKDESGTIYGKEQAELEKMQGQRVGTMIPESRLDDVILSIEIEQEDINNRLKLVYDTIRQMEARLSRFLKYDDVIDTILKTGNTSDKSLGKLKKNLVALKASEKGVAEPDAEKIEVINSLISALNDRKADTLLGDIIDKDLLQALGLVAELNQKKQYFSELLERSAQLQDKFDEYMIARDQVTNIKTIQDRINFLKAVQDGIMEGYKKIQAVNLITQTSKSVTAITKQAATEFAEYGDIMSDEGVVIGNENDEIFIGDTTKPSIANGGLFKTADKHYDDDTEDKLASPESGRFFRFSESIALDGTYYFIPVSKANDTYGITKETVTDTAGREIEVKDDIKLIVVKKVGNEYKAVGVDGKVLDNPTKDTIVYTSMPNNSTILGGTDAEVLEYLKNPKSPFSVKGMTDEAILNEVKNFKAFRASILDATKKNTPVQMKVTGRSNGVQRREILDVTTNLPQELSLHGRLIEDNPNFSDLRHPDGSPVTIEVVTSKNSANKQIKAGRLVLTKTQEAENKTKSTTTFQVYNRQLTEKEKENLFDVILAMLPMYGRRNALSDERKEALNKLFTEGKITSDNLLRLTTQLNNDEKNQFDLAVNYIAGLVHFNQLEAGAKPTYNKQFYISKGSLFVGEKEYKFEVDGTITLDNIKAAKDEILDKLYHNVNNSLLSGKRKNNSFVTATVKDGKIVEGKQFKNYLEYLLTDKSGHTPVIYTNIKKYRPTSEVNEPQLRNVYLKFEGPKEQASGEKPVAQPAAQPVAAGARPVITPSIDPETGFTSYMFVWDGKEHHFNSEMIANTILTKWIKEKGVAAAPAVQPTAQPVAQPVAQPAAATTPQAGVYTNPYDLPLEKGKRFIFSSVTGDKKAMLEISAEWDGDKFIVTKLQRTDGQAYDEAKYEALKKGNEKNINDFYTVAFKDFLKLYPTLSPTAQAKPFLDQILKEFKEDYPSIRDEGVEIKPEQPATAAPVVQPTSASTDAKADIERRREEELSREFKGINLSQQSIDTIAERSDKRAVAFIEKYDSINAKYDAELAALEGGKPVQTAAPTVNIEAEKKKLEAERDRRIEEEAPIQTMDYPLGFMSDGKTISLEKISELLKEDKENKLKALERIALILAEVGVQPLYIAKQNPEVIKKILSFYPNYYGTLRDWEGKDIDALSNKNTLRITNFFNGFQFKDIPLAWGVRFSNEKSEYTSKQIKESSAVQEKLGPSDRWSTEPNMGYVAALRWAEMKLAGQTTRSLGEFLLDTQKEIRDEYQAKIAALEGKPAESSASTGTKAPSLRSRNKTTDSSNDSNYRLWLPELTKEKENIEEFKKALAKILPQVGVEVSDRLINGRAMGQFINGMIKIYQNAGSGTGFHEAFEAVWNSYLTDKEQQTLINEFRNRKGQFTNVFTKETKDHSKASPSDVKEMLAEEFIPYMRSDNGIVVENSPVRNTIFRKIFNFFKKIWKNIQEAFGITKESPENSEINNLFRKIAEGGFANARTIDREGAEELSAFRSTLDGTNVEFTHDLMEGMMSYFFIELYKSDNNIKALFDKSKPELFNQLYEGVKNNVLDRFSENINKGIDDLIAAGFTEEEAEKEIEKMPSYDYQNLVNNYFYNTQEDKVRELFKKYLSQFGLQFENVKVKVDDEAVDAMKPQENDITDRLGIVEAMFVDPRDAIKSEVKLLVASLTADQYNSKGQIINKRNKLGLPSLEDFGRKINILNNELHSIVPVSKYDAATKSIVPVSVLDQMFDKLDDRFKRDGQYKSGYEWINKLKSRLNYQDRVTGQKNDITALSTDELSLLVAFETSFSNNRNNPYKLIVGPNGNIYADNTLDSTNANRIRERWQNNIKAQAKEFFGTTPEELANGPMIYINADGIVNFNTQSNAFKKIMDVTAPVDMVSSLRKLGFDFTVSDENVVLQVGGSKIGEDFSAIKSKFDDGSIKTFDDLFGKQIVNGRINNLVKIEQDTTSDDNILSVRNAEGKQQYSITLPSAISYLANSFKACKNITDFVASNPQLGSIDLETGDVKLNAYTAGSLLLEKGGLLFDDRGNKRKDAKLEYRYILGMSGEKEAIGTSTDRLEFPDKVMQEAFHLLDGTYFTIINSDKASEFGLNFGHLIKYSDIKFGAPGDTSNIMDAYKKALKDELRIALFEKGNNKYKIQYYSDSVQDLGHFSKILNVSENETVKKLLTDYLNGKITEDAFANESAVETLISNYLQAEVNENIKWLQDLGLVTYDKKTNTIKTKMFAVDQLKALDDNLNYNKEGAINAPDFRKLITFITVNKQLGVFEQHKLLFGHPNLYKELAKRSAGVNSQKQVISENPAYLEWMDRNLTRFDGKAQRTNTFRFTSQVDPKVVSRYINYVAEGIYESMKASFLKDGDKLSKTDKTFMEKLIGVTFNEDGSVNKIVGGKGTLIDGYENSEESDGGAYIMPDFFRDMHFLSGKLLNEQDDLLRYENAREIIDRSNPNHPMYNIPGFAKTYTQGEIDDATDLLASFAEKPKAVLPVLKPQGFGYQTTEGLMHTTFLKHSVVPLTWSRVVDKPNMLTKYLDAQANQVDVIGFTSGQKVGAVLEMNGKKIQPFYDANGVINTTPSPVQEMYTKYYGFQVEMAPYSKNSVIFGSQMRKINLSNIPADATDLRAWAEEYNKLIDSLTSTEFKGVLRDLGLRQDGDTYTTENLRGMLNTLRQEVERRDLPDNIVDMLDVVLTDDGEKLQYVFDASPVRDKLDNILNSIVDSRILAQTMHGKASVQVPSTMFEKSDRLFTYKDNDGKYVEPVKGSEIPKGKKAVMVSSDLNFPTKDKPYMEVIVPNFFKEVFKEGEEIKIEDLDPRLLQAIGFRIPTQSMAQISSIRIKGFLDPQWGDMIVVPTEIVAQAGSDFDIDKLNLFLANYYIDRKTGKPTYIEYSTSAADVENRYSRFVNESVDTEAKEYAKTLEGYSGEKTAIREKYNSGKNDIFTKFADAVGKYDEEYNKTKNEILKIASDTKSSDDTLKEYKKEGYALFTTLPQGIKQPFYDLKDEGVISVASNKALAEKLLEANPNAKYAPTLMQMIQYHEAMLDVYAQINSWTEEQINSLNDKANATFGKAVNWKESNLEKNREEFLKSIKEYNLEYVKELARIAGLPTLEEFKNFPIEEQNSKKARQNKLIELNAKMLGHPANYRQLVTPNGTATLKSIATKIRELKGLPAEESNRTSLSEWKTMSEVRERYITGKKLVGVIALQITSHSMSQYGEVELNGTYMKNGNPMSIKIKFDSNTKEGKYMLNLIEDKGHQWISELLSEAMTAAVDAARDPFIFDLNLTLNSANVWFYLQKLGVKVKDIAYLHTQPIIEKYFNEVSKNKSLLNETNKTKLSKTAIKYLTMQDFLYKAFPELEKEFNKKFKNGETFKDVVMTDGTSTGYKFNSLKKLIRGYLKQVEPTDILSTSTLESMIKPSGANKAEGLTKEQALVQLAILDDYGKYEEQGALLGNFIRAISYDTSRTKNVLENALQKGAYDQAVKDGFVKKESLDRVMKTTFLGKIKDIKDSVPDMFKDFLISVHPKTRPIIQKMLDTVLADQFMYNADKMDYLNRYQNFAITYLLHTVKSKVGNKEISLYSYYKTLMTGKNSIGKQLKEYQSKYPENTALKNLFAVINTDVKDTDNIKLFNTKLSTFEINSISEDLLKLKQVAESNNDKPLLSFVNSLGAFLVMQSGVQQSPITFSKVMPIDFYSQLVHNILTKFITDDNVEVDPEIVWRQFHQNNYKNAKFVDIISPSQLQRDEEFYDVFDEGTALHNALSPSLEYIFGKGEFVTIQQLKPEVENDKALYAKLAKNKQWDKVYDYTLYQRIGEGKEGEASPYMPINKLGNGMYLTEATPDEYAISILEKNGNLKSEYYKEQAEDLLSRIGTVINEENPDVKGSIKLNVIENWVQNGTATATVRNENYHKKFYNGDGVYRTDGGNEVNIKHLGLVELKGDKIVGDNVSLTKDEFAKAEGYGTWENFQKEAQYAGVNLMKGEMVHMYEISPVKQDMGRQVDIEPGYGLTAANFQNNPEVEDAIKQMEQESKKCNE